MQRSALPLARGGDVRWSGRAIRRRWLPSAYGCRLRVHRSDGLRRSCNWKTPALLGLRLPADQGPGASARQEVVRTGYGTYRTHSAQRKGWRVSAPSRGVLGDPPRRLLLSLLLG